MRYTVETVGGDELEAHNTLSDATRSAVERLQDDPELGELYVYGVGREAPMGAYLKTITTAPDRNWDTHIVVLDYGEKIQPPAGAYLPRRITEEDLEGYDLSDPKRIGIERMMGEWV